MGKIVSDWIVETASAQSNISDLARAVASYNETLGKSKDAGKKAFDDSTKAAKDFNRELANGTQIYQKVGANAGAFRSEMKRLEGVYADLKKQQKQFIAEGRYDELQKNIAGVKSRIAELKGEFNESGKSGGVFKSILGDIGGQLLAMGSIGAIVGIGKQIFDVTAEFEKFEAVLTTSLGSNSAAERAMFMIQDFAASTPFSVAELTDSYVKLANRGIRPTKDEMTALGDLASSTGKSFDQLTEAALDAMTGENERLKEFGVQAQKSGDKTFYTFKGVTTEVKNTSEAVKEYLISLGKMDGVAGSSAAISETLTGKLSNLGDSFDQLFLTLGNSEGGVMGNTIEMINGLVSSLTFLVSTTEMLGKKASSEAVSKYAEELTRQFKTIAEEARKTGKDIKEALDFKSFSMENDLKEQLIGAEKKLKDFQKERDSALNTINELTDVTGFQRSKNKTIEATLATEVQRIKGQLAAISDAKNEALKPANSGIDPDAAKKAADAAKKAAAERKRALAELQKELESLEKEAAKARLSMLDKNSKEYQDALLKARLKEIDQVETELIAASKKAGKGGKLGAKQLEQLGVLKQAANQDYNQALEKMAMDQAEKLLDLQKNSDDKELLQIDLKYRKQIDAARKAGNEQLALALEKARELELIETGQKQGLKNLADGEALATAEVEGGKFVTNSFKPVDIEKAKQEAILRVQIDFAKKRLALLETIGGEENKLIIQQTKNTIASLEKELEKSTNKKQQFNLLDLLGVKEEDRDEVNQAFQEVAGFITEFTQQQLAAANELLQQREADVDSKREDLNTEIELNKAGFASNVETKRAELEESKRLRQQALEDQRKAAKAQAAVETVQQTIGLITSSVDIIKGFSKIPIIGLPLGIAAVTAMFGAFVSAKAKAAKVAKFEKGGLLGGRRHSQGGNKYYSEGGDVMEHEEGEYFVNRKATAKRLDWLEAINEDDQERLRDLAVRELLEGTGVTTAKNTAKKVQAKSDALTAATAYNGSIKLNNIERELMQIRKNTGNDGLKYEDENKKVYQSGNVTRTIIKKR
jgi:hypothetical protein